MSAACCVACPAAVEAAENWGTYVMVHAYTPRAVQQAIRAGVTCVEHGQRLDDETVELMAENEVWWSLQPFLDDEDAPPVPPGSRPKFEQMVTGTETAYELAKKHDVRLAWGTDTLFDPALAVKQGKQLAKMTRWFTPAEVLTMATVTNAELLSLSAARNPYPGVLGDRLRGHHETGRPRQGHDGRLVPLKAQPTGQSWGWIAGSV